MNLTIAGCLHLCRPQKFSIIPKMNLSSIDITHLLSHTPIENLLNKASLLTERIHCVKFEKQKIKDFVRESNPI